MSESIYDLLAPYFDHVSQESRPEPSDATTTKYLNRITTLSLSDLSTTEPGSLSQTATSNLRSLQALSKRSQKPIISAAENLSTLTAQLPDISKESYNLKHAIPAVESKAAAFAEKYRKSNEASNPVVIERRNALLLARNVDRISSVLDLPTLLSSAISSGQQPGTGQSASTSSSSAVSYASALDLHAHVKRLAVLYSDSPLVASIGTQSEREMRLLTSNLITGLRGQGIKLASAMRTLGWLRRVAPELDEQMRAQARSGVRGGRQMMPTTSPGSGDGALGALFLVCRLASLDAMLDALDPLKELADHESIQRSQAKQQAAEEKNNKNKRDTSARTPGPTGQQTERYLKRYIEIFREQSFAIVSMYKSIFPGALAAPGSQELQSIKSASKGNDAKDLLLPLPSPLATFPSHLVDRLFDTLKIYLPNIRDAAARDSLMTQILYCAGSLGRLGGDFSLMLALLEEEISEEFAEDEISQTKLDDDEEWVKVMKKHRINASRLELLASGVTAGKHTKHSTVISP
ncbi:Dor1-like family protein-like protein [Microthyrium microscopicum]|uniref:Conserved oligomeric Golgi complex subunit 8 n=1 Tax=Microthyrium microscopicum TaxID=703497 RepID=A0A6A6U1L2_9PEZI|nr:Dor1-like family protein-like protein [Microthyrium microscopicum]